MRLSVLDAAAVTAVLLLLSTAVCAAESAVASPHSEAGDCGICHVAPADKLRSWFAFASTKREMKVDLNQMCLKCHPVEPSHAGSFIGVGLGHATGKKTALNNRNLPLASDGTITCAITCHDIHIAPKNGQPRNKLLRLPVNELCLSCHNM